MFIRSDIGEAKKPTSISENRTVGALVLIAAIAILVLVALTADASIFSPLNASDTAATQTYRQQPLLPPGHPPIPSNPNNPNNSQSPVKFDAGHRSPNVI